MYYLELSSETQNNAGNVLWLYEKMYFSQMLSAIETSKVGEKKEKTKEKGKTNMPVNRAHEGKGGGLTTNWEK